MPLRIISPDSSKKSQDIGSMALLGHEAEYHYHSLEPVVSTRSSQSAVNFLIDYILSHTNNTRTTFYIDKSHNRTIMALDID